MRHNSFQGDNVDYERLRNRRGMLSESLLTRSEGSGLRVKRGNARDHQSDSGCECMCYASNFLEHPLEHLSPHELAILIKTSIASI